ncbi:RNA-binding protein CP29B, chloroplastic-like isoform X1 [Hibiscus syriacus]|uniref:RNA-binding protein CP29B, chloroplastic-like isoform X1 n=1 Tax=Hibiscus syriacus TaxID=106335 RepID=UPI00192293A8|nr:RNA-binding protein CP29B, chloroplastic-like isoform X1 [Hibiscus syriacus]XP_039042161.1 RNA-binding protein CP29B, chloroplastic-like isoform X1 [Hibiscus syriacus]
MSAISASSLILQSLKPKALSLPNSTPISLSLFSLPHKPHAKPLFCSALQSFEILAKRSSFSSRFVRNVAVSSEYGQEEDLFGSDEDGEEAPDFSPDLKLFVGNLPFSVDSAQLAGLFGSAGNVKVVEVIYDKVTSRSRGFAFVTMSTIEEVEAAEQQFNGYELEGRSLRVNSGPPPPRREDFSPRGARGRGDFSPRGARGREDFSPRGARGREDYSPRGARGGPPMGNSNRVYVGNLSWGVDDMALENLFSEQGSVVEAKVVYDRESGRSRGFGFVTYNSSEEVDRAVRSLNGSDLDGRPIRVTVAESRPRREF